MKSVRNKLVSLALIVILIPTLLVGIVSYFITKSEPADTGRLGLENGTYAMVNMIEALDKQVEKSQLTLEEAQEQARIQLVGQKTGEKSRSIDNPVKYG